MLITDLFDQIKPDIRKILQKSLDSEDINENEALSLLRVTGKEFFALQYVANKLCLERKKNVVTFVVNRNINFTNICNQRCKFCSFSVPNNADDAFLLSLNEIREKTIEASESGCTELCIQGGINPDLDFDYYLQILKTVKNVEPTLHIHAFSPQEIFRIASLKGDTLKNTLRELKNAGLNSIPGTAAEILSDDIRKIICPNKVPTSKWIEIIKTAHELKIPTTSTIMYGHVEDLKHRVEHLKVIRDIQKETNGFTEFVPLPFVKENPILSRLKDFPLKLTSGIDDLKLFCVARIYFNDYIDNIQCSWVKLGPKFAQVSLNYGVNDFSGTLMEENISRSAGAEFGQILHEDEIISIIKSAGKIPAQRDTIYNIVKRY
ncbi:MAG: 7,8-didemethyl-8-hydroxy-5-deazariboflavin synthase subunit CofH [Candidatus Lokiarchaeota archaeon]|nr:7,8-didemethyl-8-hydroxy-5-deazariboflavin synthase subunit CofH [Candidatus Lokiarchaeota archaeon]MBD3342984.1 7,8-didemethyl-8-hydroxy-5-deazariboflavin synthase subunit CofH [Candidatus Lokiarchaeota archaeon]